MVCFPILRTGRSLKEGQFLFQNTHYVEKSGSKGTKWGKGTCPSKGGTGSKFFDACLLWGCASLPGRQFKIDINEQFKQPKSGSCKHRICRLELFQPLMLVSSAATVMNIHHFHPANPQKGITTFTAIVNREICFQWRLDEDLGRAVSKC